MRGRALLESWGLGGLFAALLSGISNPGQRFDPPRPRPAKSAAINRWTGQPHEHNRSKRPRGATHDRRGANERFAQRYPHMVTA